MTFRYVIFDYNGTIVDDVNTILVTINNLLEHYGAKKISLERLRNTFRLPYVDFYKENGVRLEKKDISKHQEMFTWFYTKAFYKYSKVPEGLVQTLKYLKNKEIPIGLLSSWKTDLIKEELSHLRILDFFDTIVAEDNIIEIGTKGFKDGDNIIKNLNIKNPSDALKVGDMVYDIVSARKFGFKIAVVTYGWNSKERLLSKKPDYVISSITEIKKLF